MITKTPWIKDYLKMYKVSDKVIEFIAEAMKNWKGELFNCNKIFTQ